VELAPPCPQYYVSEIAKRKPRFRNASALMSALTAIRAALDGET
jgi:hypothetical protein